MPRDRLIPILYLAAWFGTLPLAGAAEGVSAWSGTAGGGANAALIADGRRPARAEENVRGAASQDAVLDLRASVAKAAQETARAALDAAQNPPPSAKADAQTQAVLPLEGMPGDVRLVCMRTSVIQRSRWIVPRIPFPPFTQWNRWLDEHPNVTHSALDWMDERGQWWHTELRGLNQHAAKYRVGQGEFRASGVTIYGVFILPGRTDLEGQPLLADEKISCDFRILEAEARNYARKDKRRGDPGTGGRGARNVGLGGPAWRPSCNSNTYIHHLLKCAGVERQAPEGAVGWETVPHFPYSSDADAYGR